MTTSVVEPLSPVGTPAGLRHPDESDLAAMLLIRHFEQALLRLFSEGRLNGTTHTCLGQEYIPVALRSLLAPGDFIFSNHRGHGHYLARYDDPEGLLAEITGRAGAVCSGVGGSQHIHRTGYMSTGIQGESLPVAAGVALHMRRSGERRIAVAFIGDGTWGEGSVYEALNLAALWRLPLLVVVENNRIAQSTPTSVQMSGDIAGRAAAFGVEHTLVSGYDITALAARLAPVVDRVRGHQGPAVVEFDTYRMGPHSKGDDTRDPAEVARARAHDWYDGYRARLPELFARIDRAQRDRVERAVEDVLGRGESSWQMGE